MRALALVLLLAGCTEHTDLLPSDGGADGCTTPGPFIRLDPQSACAGALAASLMRYAVCSCAPLVLTHGLLTEGGGPGPKPMPGMPPMAPIAAVGTDGYVQISGPVQVAGSLEAAGFDGALFDRTSAVLGTLRSAGPIGSNQYLSIDGDAYAGGDVIGRIDIGGVLHLETDANVSFMVNASGEVREPIKVAPPCNCAAGSPIDVPGLIAMRAQQNDDARIGLAPGAFATAGGPTTLELPCGEYYLDSMHSGSAELVLGVHGHVALFIGGDVNLANGLRVVLDPAAELDLVVGGNVTVQAGIVGASAAASVRVWLGSSAVKIFGGVNLSALIYAPSAVVTSESDLVVTGALFVRQLAVDGDVAVHYDATALEGGVACGAPSQDPVN